MVLALFFYIESLRAQKCAFTVLGKCISDQNVFHLLLQMIHILVLGCLITSSFHPELLKNEAGKKMDSDGILLLEKDDGKRETSGPVLEIQYETPSSSQMYGRVRKGKSYIIHVFDACRFLWYLRVDCIFWCCHRDMKCNCLITWQITPEGHYVKPCNKAVAFHISMTEPKYAINPYNCTHSSL